MNVRWFSRSCSGVISSWLALFYLLPPSYLFDEDLRQKQKVRTLQVHQQTTIYHPSLPKGEIVFREVTYIDNHAPQKKDNKLVSIGRFRQESFYPQAVLPPLPIGKQQRAAFVKRTLIGKGDRLLYADAKKSEPQLPNAEMLLLFYLYRDVATLMQVLGSHGYDTSIRKLASLGERIVYQLGNPEKGDVLWFDKQLMHPLGFTYAKGKFSVRWDGAEAKSTEAFYPREISFYNGEQLVEKRRITAIKINVSLTESLFDIATITSRAAVENESTTRLSQLIEKVRREYR